jgi:hypothetical protein
LKAVTSGDPRRIAKNGSNIKHLFLMMGEMMLELRSTA